MKRNEFNEDFFEDDNELSFYWAGFIAGSSSVDPRLSRNQIIVNHANLKILKKLIKDINFKGKLLKRKKNSYRIIMSSPKLLSDLARFEIQPYNFKNLDLPDWLQKHKLVNHFIRGYFDSHGYVMFDMNGNKVLGLSGRKTFLEKIHNYFKSKVITRAKVRPHANSNVVTYCGNLLVTEVGKLLYKDATRFNSVKKQKVMSRANAV